MGEQVDYRNRVYPGAVHQQVTCLLVGQETHLFVSFTCNIDKHIGCRREVSVKQVNKRVLVPADVELYSCVLERKRSVKRKKV